MDHNHAKKLEELIRELPQNLQKEVGDFVAFLSEKRFKKRYGKPRFDWANALESLRDRYTSVDLQHQSSEWRNGKK